MLSKRPADRLKLLKENYNYKSIFIQFQVPQMSACRDLLVVTSGYIWWHDSAIIARIQRLSACGANETMYLSSSVKVLLHAAVWCSMVLLLQLQVVFYLPFYLALYALARSHVAALNHCCGWVGFIFA